MSLITAASAGGWRCEVCCVSNDTAVEICVCCETPKPGLEKVESGPIFKNMPSAGQASAFVAPTAAGGTVGGFKPSTLFAAPPTTASSTTGQSTHGVVGFRPVLGLGDGGSLGGSLGFKVDLSSATTAGGGFKPMVVPTTSTTASSGAKVPAASSAESSPFSLPTSADGSQEPEKTGGNQIADKNDDEAMADNDGSTEVEDAEEVCGIHEAAEESVITKPGSSENYRVFMWGSGECDQLPVSDEDLSDDMALPLPMQILKDFPEIKSVACGALHSLAVLGNGKVVTWGCNDDFALGRVGEDDERIPGYVDGLEKVRMISAGDNHCAAITEAGECFIWGSYKDSGGHIGFPLYPRSKFERKWRTPTQVEGLPKGNVETLVSGENHTGVITRTTPAKQVDTGDENEDDEARRGDGSHLEVWLWGNGEFGQLGNTPAEGHEEEDFERRRAMLYPRRVIPSSLKGVSSKSPEVLGLYSGGCTTFLAIRDKCPTGGSSEGTGRNVLRLLGCGRNAMGEVGLTSTRNFKGFDVGEDGMKDDNETAADNEKIDKVVEFTELKELRDVDIRKLVGGQFFTAMLTKSGEVWSWGQRDFSCHPPKSKTSSPSEPLHIPTKICGVGKIREAGCGEIVSLGTGAGTGFLTTDKGFLFSWGDSQQHQLGLGEALDEPVSRLHAIRPERFGGQFVVHAHGGSQHSVAVVATEEVSRRRDLVKDDALEKDRRIKKRQRHAAGVSTEGTPSDGLSTVGAPGRGRVRQRPESSANPSSENSSPLSITGSGARQRKKVKLDDVGGVSGDTPAQEDVPMLEAASSALSSAADSVAETEAVEIGATRQAAKTGSRRRMAAAKKEKPSTSDKTSGTDDDEHISASAAVSEGEEKPAPTGGTRRRGAKATAASSSGASSTAGSPDEPTRARGRSSAKRPTRAAASKKEEGSSSGEVGVDSDGNSRTGSAASSVVSSAPSKQRGPNTSILRKQSPPPKEKAKPQRSAAKAKAKAKVAVSKKKTAGSGSDEEAGPPPRQAAQKTAVSKAAAAKKAASQAKAERAAEAERTGMSERALRLASRKRAGG